MPPALIRWLASGLLLGAAFFFASGQARADVVQVADPASCSTVWSQACQTALFNAGCDSTPPAPATTSNLNNTASPLVYLGITFPPFSCGSFYVDGGGAGVLVTMWTFAAQCSDDNQPVTGMVPRTGQFASSPPQQVCNESCTYSLDTATNVTDTNGNPAWLGTWRRDGGTCLSEPTPGASPDTSPPAEAAEGVDQANDAVRKDLTSTIGPPLQFPTIPFLTPPGVRTCKLAVTTPAALVSLLGPTVEADFCGHLETIDRIGGWLLYITTALTIFGLFVKGPDQ